MSSSIFKLSVNQVARARAGFPSEALFCFRCVTQSTSAAQPPHGAEWLRLSVALFFYVRLRLVWRHSLQLIQGPDGKALPGKALPHCAAAKPLWWINRMTLPVVFSTLDLPPLVG